MQLLGPDDKWPMRGDESVIRTVASQVRQRCFVTKLFSRWKPKKSFEFVRANIPFGQISVTLFTRAISTIQRKSLITETASFARKMPLRLLAGWYRNFSRTPLNSQRRFAEPSQFQTILIPCEIVIEQGDENGQR